MQVTLEEAEQKLSDVFGHNKFKHRQWEIIDNLFHQKKILLIEKTGLGKSICYQFPSLYFEGVTLVFSPLIALMRDQVNYLKSKNIAAECINSENSPSKNERIIQKAENNELKLLYIAPERQESHNWENLISSLDVSMIVIDEAHCISVWGHDFRPTYKRIVQTISRLPDVPILGVTATATKTTEEDIANQMGGNVEIVRGRLNRPNLQLNVLETTSLDDKLSLLVQIIKQMEGVGIVFAGTRQETEFITNVLNSCGIKSVHYHAGIPNRDQVEKETLQDKWKCIVATNSFGMGIDKADFRYILHTRFPASPIHYYQEIGRAGRDGRPAKIYLLWESSDVELQQYFIEQSKPSFKVYYDVIDYVKDNAETTVYKISLALDYPQQMVENVLNDLNSQNIIEIHTEISEELPYYMLLEDANIKLIKNQIENEVKKYSDKINDQIIYLTLDKLMNDQVSDYKLASEVLGRTTNENREIMQKIIDTIIHVQEKTDENFINVIERFNKKTTYSLNEKQTDLDEISISRVKLNKIEQLDKMQEYLKFSHCRMRFLCDYLGDKKVSDCEVCDYCRLKDPDNRDWKAMHDLCVNRKEKSRYPFRKHTCGTCNECMNIEDFYDNNIPTIPLVYPSEENTDIAERRNKVIDGHALTYDFTKLGQSIKKIKNHNLEYADKIVEQLVKLYNTKIKPNNIEYDMILHVPPVDGSTRMKNLTKKLSQKIGLHVSNKLCNYQDIEAETEFDTTKKKMDYLKNKFEYDNPEDIRGKSVLLVDEIYHSKATIREIGNYLKDLDVKVIQPIYLIKNFQ